MTANDARFDRIAEKIMSLQEVLARGGAIVASWRWRAGRRYGPYYRLAYRCDGRQCAVYLGGSAALVEKVRGLLRRLQEPLRVRRRVGRMRRAAMASLRQVKADLKRVMRSRGLYARGAFNLRGWREYAKALQRGHAFPEVRLESCPSADQESGKTPIALTNNEGRGPRDLGGPNTTSQACHGQGNSCAASPVLLAASNISRQGAKPPREENSTSVRRLGV